MWYLLRWIAQRVTQLRIWYNYFRASSIFFCFCFSFVFGIWYSSSGEWRKCSQMSLNGMKNCNFILLITKNGFPTHYHSEQVTGIESTKCSWENHLQKIFEICRHASNAKCFWLQGFRSYFGWFCLSKPSTTTSNEIKEENRQCSFDDSMIHY